MAALANANEVVEELRQVRQARLYHPKPVPEDVIHQLLEIARWTGSSRNTQPWHFVVVTDKEQLRQISTLRTPITWVADAPLAIAVVLNGENETAEAYDEGRVTERLLFGARALGLGGGIAWVGDEAGQAAREGTPRHPGGADDALRGGPRLPHHDEGSPAECEYPRPQAALRDRQLRQVW